ncbi:hypothetical protein NECID01_0004 [Nematocida sp. AWRm77]|nr:hypothetical protein NECID01_0004 [Nematocida sp. AWRm77]
MNALHGKAERAKTLQKEMDCIITELQEKYGYALGEPLVDQDAFPRKDIDVYSISKLLSRYKAIQKEWVPLRKELEEAVFLKYSTEDE